MKPTASEMSYRIICDLLEERTGQQMAEARRWRIDTALSGLMRERGISNIDQLVCMLPEPGEWRLPGEIVEALLNNETYFLRDRVMFDTIRDVVLPDLARRREHVRRLSIWSVGCSTGQETLSLAMLFLNDPGRWHGWTIDILGTDISEVAIEKARRGRYSQFEIQRGLGITEMLNFFDESPDGWQAKPELLRSVRYQVHNIRDLPPGRADFDLILCRNVLLYFSTDARRHAFDRLATAIAPHGWLMLGAGETVVGQTDRFKAADKPLGFYLLKDA